MRNKHGHKYIGRNEYGMIFDGDSKQSTCPNCAHLDDHIYCSLKARSNLTRQQETCSEFGERGYYYDGIEIKIQTWLNEKE